MKKVVFLAAVCIGLIMSCESPGSETRLTPVSDGFTAPVAKDISMYEVNIGAFSQERNLNGVRGRLEHIKAMGANVIWLMPVHPTGIQNSFGSPYCVRDYYSVNPAYGTMADLKNLVDAAHDNGIAVIMDWVGNHTSWDNPWISQHPDWYTTNAAGNIISPEGTNWNDVADLNFENPAMRQEIIAAMQFWIDQAGIDGYRCDAADWIPFSFWDEAIRSLSRDSAKGLIFLAEGERADHFQAGFTMNFGWDFLSAVKDVYNGADAGGIFAAHEAEVAALPPTCRKLRFITNHDETNHAVPAAVFGGNDAALSAMVLAAFFNGSALMYSGQEADVASPQGYLGVIDWGQNVALQQKYAKIMDVRRGSVVARSGFISSVGNDDVVGLLKQIEASQLLVLVNVRNGLRPIVLPEGFEGEWQDMVTGGPVTLTPTIELGAFQYRILARSPDWVSD